MIIKCIKPACEAVMSVPNITLKEMVENGKKPILKCKQCNTGLEIKPLKAICSNPDCDQLFTYYDFKLKLSDPKVKCPACGKINKVTVRPAVKLVMDT